MDRKVDLIINPFRTKKDANITPAGRSVIFIGFCGGIGGSFRRCLIGGILLVFQSIIPCFRGDIMAVEIRDLTTWTEGDTLAPVDLGSANSRSSCSKKTVPS